jgi:phosphoglycerate dehydrogenase-like enzyme
VTAPRVAIGPAPADPVTEAVASAGGELVGLGERPDALVWLDAADVDGLGSALGAAPSARWVQLPFAGVEAVLDAGLLSEDRTWTSAKGTYGLTCAEHALMLATAGLRHLPDRIRARSWGGQGAATLAGADVTIVGGGGIAAELVRLLQPFDAQVTVVRRRAGGLTGAVRTLTVDRLHDALPAALVVFLALALTPRTHGIIGEAELAAMRPDAWLVNVARGPHVDTDALVAALRSGSIGGAGLDVTDPEPLPDGHPLWDLDNCIITPHTANPPSLALPLLAARIRRNVAAYAAGEPLEGLVDPAAGY